MYKFTYLKERPFSKWDFKSEENLIWNEMNVPTKGTLDLPLQFSGIRYADEKKRIYIYLSKLFHFKRRWSTIFISSRIIIIIFFGFLSSIIYLIIYWKETQQSLLLQPSVQLNETVSLISFICLHICYQFQQSSDNTSVFIRVMTFPS